MKKAIVIGATKGIGRELAKILIKEGYKVGITGIEKNILGELRNASIENLEIEYLDCTKDNSCKKVNELAKKLGGLDLLVFSAGICFRNENLKFELENRTNKLNVLGFTNIAGWSYKYFREKGSGHFVAITSVAGLRGYCNAPAYHAGKSFQINYLEGLRQKAAKSGKPIYVTDIRPGFVDTDMVKGKKTFWLTKKEEAARQIYDLIQKRKEVGYVSKRWKIIAFILRLLPSWIHKRI